MEPRRLTLRPRDTPPLAIVIALTLVLAGWGGHRLTTEAARERARREIAERAGQGGVALVTALDEAIATLSETGEAIDPPGPGVAVVRPRGSGYAVEVAGPAVADPGDLAPPSFMAVALDGARDRGQPVVASGRADSDTTSLAVVVVPVYAPGEAPGDTASRRAAVAGFGVVRINVDQLAADAFAAVAPARVEVRDGQGIIASVGSEVGAARSKSVVTVGERSWSVSVSGPVPGPPASAWLVLAAGVALAALVLAAATRRSAMARGAEEEAARRSRENRLLAELGPMLQSSLDLGEMLPAVCVRLVDEFNLDRVTIDTREIGAAGGLFSHTTPAWRDSDGRGPGAPNGELVLPLLRGGRAFGSVTLHPRRPLSLHQRQALEAAAELTAGAVANAATFETEQAAVDRLAELSRLKTEFMGTISHELRTPLTAIVGYAHVLEAGWDTVSREDARDYVRRINRNASSLASLLQQVLDFSRLERQRLEFAIQKIDLVDVVQQALDAVSPMCGERKLQLNAPPSLPARSDPDPLERVVVNLLTNAVKFSPDGSTVTVSLSEEENGPVITVDDEGSGIDRSEWARVFARFYRGTSDAALRTRGAGIGLAVVKEVLDGLGGSVEVGDSPAGGARFVVRLPVHEPIRGVPPADAQPGVVPEGGLHEVTT